MEPTCNHVSDGRRCGKPAVTSNGNCTDHWGMPPAGRPEEPKVDQSSFINWADEVIAPDRDDNVIPGIAGQSPCAKCGKGMDGAFDNCKKIGDKWYHGICAEAIAPEPKPEPLSEYRTGYRDGLAQGIFDQQMDDAIKRGEISLTSEAEGVTASESNLVECRCNCNPFCGCVCHKTGAEGAVKACGISVLSKSRGCFECALKEGHEGKHQPKLAEGAVKPDRDFTGPTVAEAERFIRKMGKCEGIAAKLILLKHFMTKHGLAPDQQEGSQKEKL